MFFVYFTGEERMDSRRLFDPGHGHKAFVAFVICLVVTAGAVVVASLIQTDFGRVAVTNVTSLQARSTSGPWSMPRWLPGKYRNFHFMLNEFGMIEYE